MPATGDGRAPGAADLPGAHGGAPVGHARNRTTTGRATAVSPIPHPRSRAAHAGHPSHVSEPGAGPADGPADDAPLRLLVIEDDASDAQLIKAAVADSGTSIEIHWARGLDQATELLAPPALWARRGRSRTPEFGCVLLDLAAPADLPDPERGHLPASRTGGGSDGLEGLHELLRRAPHTPVVVLTDAAGAELGAAAVAAGAQDFLLKHDTDGPLLARALRYAVERKRADESQRRLVEAELRGQENARLQRHLLPTPLLDGAGLSFTRRYRPGRRRALLGGDFYDAVRTDDGTVHVVIGDVCGHGPDEAALGVALRIAWRTLVFAGLTGEALLATLQHVLEHERRSEEIFATLCMLVIEPDDTESASG
ncbi:PP2C family protein-serine/threonine phosphatase, partial [Kitasatospora sp. NPDC056783]|uniref:PP2C family protein-serine/threonine phosphatase n=1 Tax=Kitasatospora sp. NPDC056783 TaxID=3345943 RepID=UPI0036B57CEE